MRGTQGEKGISQRRKKRKGYAARLNEERGEITERGKPQQQKVQVEYDFLNSPAFII